MNRVPRLAQCALWIACAFIFAVATSSIYAQDNKPAAPSQDQAQKSPDTDKAGDKDKKEEGDNPFAPEPAPTLPPGMTGSDANDPRANLKPGMFDAGETSMGLEHLLLVKKPDAFQLGS